MNVFNFFFADSGPVIHIAPGVIFHIGKYAITNSIFYGWISVFIMIVLLVIAAKKMTIFPKKGPIQLVEVTTEFILNTVDTSFEDKDKAKKYRPYFVTLFFFILFNNWLGLLPFVGEGFTLFGFPVLRPFTADLNATFAMGAVTMIYVYYSSVKESGGLKEYLNHFFVGNPKNPLYLIIGMLEMLTDITRVISLSLRLFLNIAIGEIVIAVFSYLGHIIAPLTALPFTLIELFVTALQAYIFTILSIMYLAIVVNHKSEEHAETT